MSGEKVERGIRKVGDTYQVRVTYRDLKTGRRGELTDTAKTLTEARKLHRKLEERRDRGVALGTGKEPVRDHVDTWLAQLARDGRSPRTVEGYEDKLTRFVTPVIGDVRMCDVRPAHIQAVMNAVAEHRTARTGEPLSAQTRRHVFRVMHTMFQRAMRMEIIERNPCANVVTPEVPLKKARYMELADVGRLLAHLETNGPDAVYAASVIAVMCGLRRGEIVGLRWADVDLVAGTLTVARSVVTTKAGLVEKAPKTELSARTVDMPAAAVKALKAYRSRQAARRQVLGSRWQGGAREDDVVVDNTFGGMMRPDTLSKQFHEAATTLKLDVSFHSLRHTFASLLLGDGEKVNVVSGMLGHSTVTLTWNTYSHVLEGAGKKAAKRMDKLLKTATR